jgi:hypothetical protein
MIGLFVAEVEPIDGVLDVSSRLTIIELQDDDAHLRTASIAPEPQLAVADSFKLVKDRARPIATEGDFIAVGIDVGGRPHKGYDLCRLVWVNGRIADMEFASRPHDRPLPPTAGVRARVAAGEMERVAEGTWSAASATAQALWETVERFAGQVPDAIFIDSPSGFARNRLGHGRLTEKQHIVGVSFQSTPSLCCGREHGADWGWLVYGMVAFAACLHRGDFTLEEWVAALRHGLHEPTRASAFTIRECFPTATISTMRGQRTAPRVKQLLAEGSLESQIVQQYLDAGVSAVKGPQPVFDRADALVAALSSLPYVRPEFEEQSSWPSELSVRWQPSEDNAHLLEGVIALPVARF